MAITTTGDFGELLEPGLRSVYGTAYKSYPEQYTKIFDVRTSGKRTEYMLSISGFGLVNAKTESASVDYDEPVQGFKSSQTAVTYGKGFSISREMYEDDQYNIINKYPKALARSNRVTIEQTGADVLNRAFNSSYTGGDTKELCATDHPLIGGGTYANELSTSADFDVTSLEQALLDIGDMVDDRGLLLQAMGKKLVGPPELQFQFARTLKSTLDPESAMNTVNAVANVLPFEINNYLTDPDAWFIITDIPDGLICYWRRKPEFTRDNDFDSENAKFKTTFRVSFGWGDPRQIFGSPGA